MIHGELLTTYTMDLGELGEREVDVFYTVDPAIHDDENDQFTITGLYFEEVDLLALNPPLSERTLDSIFDYLSSLEL